MPSHALYGKLIPAAAQAPSLMHVCYDKDLMHITSSRQQIAEGLRASPRALLSLIIMLYKLHKSSRLFLTLSRISGHIPVATQHKTIGLGLTTSHRHARKLSDLQRHAHIMA